MGGAAARARIVAGSVTVSVVAINLVTESIFFVIELALLAFGDIATVLFGIGLLLRFYSLVFSL